MKHLYLMHSLHNVQYWHFALSFYVPLFPNNIVAFCYSIQMIIRTPFPFQTSVKTVLLIIAIYFFIF